jgi:hypothetical protein
MVKRCVESRSGSQERPPICGGSPSCSPLWRRYCHDCSLGDAGPWRRLHDTAECAGTGPDAADRLFPRPRPAGRIGGGLCTMGPMAASQGRFGSAEGGRRSPSAGSRPFRACAPAKPDGCIHPVRHAQHRPRSLGGVVGRPAVVQSTATNRSATRPVGLGLAHEPFERAINRNHARRVARRRAPNRNAIPHHDPEGPPTGVFCFYPAPPGQPAGHPGYRGD